MALFILTSSGRFTRWERSHTNYSRLSQEQTTPLTSQTTMYRACSSISTWVCQPVYISNCLCTVPVLSWLSAPLLCLTCKELATLWAYIYTCPHSFQQQLHSLGIFHKLVVELSTNSGKSRPSKGHVHNCSFSCQSGLYLIEINTTIVCNSDFSTIEGTRHVVGS